MQGTFHCGVHMRYMIIKGNVVGGHRISDLGLLVPYGEEAVIPVVRASWSSDLSKAIQDKSVLRLGYRNTPTAARSAPTVPAVAQNNRVPPKRPKPKYQPPPKVQSPEERRIKELSEMNEALLQSVETLVASQKETQDLLKTVLTSGISVNPVVQGSQVGAPAPATPQDTAPEEDDWDEFEEEPVHFIPSKIRSESTKLSEKPLEASQESSEVGGKMNASVEALKALKKRNKK